MANKFWPAGKNFVAAAISLHSTCSGQISAPDRQASAKRETERERKGGEGEQNKDGDGSEKRLQQLTLIKCASVYVSCGDISVV